MFVFLTYLGGVLSRHHQRLISYRESARRQTMPATHDSKHKPTTNLLLLGLETWILFRHSTQLRTILTNKTMKVLRHLATFPSMFFFFSLFPSFAHCNITKRIFSRLLPRVYVAHDQTIFNNVYCIQLTSLLIVHLYDHWVSTSWVLSHIHLNIHMSTTPNLSICLIKFIFQAQQNCQLKARLEIAIAFKVETLSHAMSLFMYWYIRFTHHCLAMRWGTSPS